MTILTLDQIKAIEPNAFSGPGPDCDACHAIWLADQQPWRTKYGPFEIWCCHPCHVQVEASQERKAKKRNKAP